MKPWSCGSIACLPPAASARETSASTSARLSHEIESSASVCVLVSQICFVVKSANNYCSVRYTFTPLAGKTYLLSGASVEKGCAARVMDMSDPEHIKPELGALRRNPTGLACLPLSQSRAASVAGHDAAHVSGEAVLRQGAGTDDLQGLIGQ